MVAKDELRQDKGDELQPWVTFEKEKGMERRAKWEFCKVGSFLLLVGQTQISKKQPWDIRKMVGSVLFINQSPIGPIHHTSFHSGSQPNTFRNDESATGDIKAELILKKQKQVWNCGALGLWDKLNVEETRATGTRDSTLQNFVEDNGWINQRENGKICSFDATKCMFSQGNFSEQPRMTTLECKEEVIVDMFTAIGYLMLFFLVRAHAKLVDACEWQPHSIEALPINLQTAPMSVTHSCYTGEIVKDSREMVASVRGEGEVLLGQQNGRGPSHQSSFYKDPNLNTERNGLVHKEVKQDMLVFSFGNEEEDPGRRQRTTTAAPPSGFKQFNLEDKVVQGRVALLGLRTAELPVKGPRVMRVYHRKRLGN